MTGRSAVAQLLKNSLPQEDVRANERKRQWAREVSTWESPDLPPETSLEDLITELLNDVNYLYPDGSKDERIRGLVHGRWIELSYPNMNDPLFIDRVLIHKDESFEELATHLLLKILHDLPNRPIVLTTLDPKVFELAARLGFFFPDDTNPYQINIIQQVLRIAGLPPQSLALLYISDPDIRATRPLPIHQQ